MISQLSTKTLSFVLVTSLTYCWCDSNYQSFSKCRTFVDKSKLLRIFFSTENRRNFITCPRRFGKSANLNMIKTFGQVELDETKKPINWKFTRAHEIFKNLTISNYPRIVSRHLARYVVVLLDLNPDHMAEPTTSTILDHLNQQITKVYREYRWILDGNHNVDSEDMIYMQKVIEGTLGDDQKYQYLHRLAKIVYKALNGIKSVILIDDYDGPMTKIPFDHTLDTSQYYHLLNKMVSEAYTAASQYIDYILITGTSSMTYYSSHAGYSIDTDVVSHHPFLEDHPLVSFCGYLEKELKTVLDRRGLRDMDRYQMKECYNGYRTRLKHRSVYNSHSVSLYLNKSDCNVTEYWTKRYQEQNVKFYPRPEESDVDRYWSIDLRDGVIFSFIYLTQFLNDISIPAHSDNRIQINSTISKIYNQDSFQRFCRFLKIITNYSADEARQVAQDGPNYLPIFRTYAFEHGYFTHSTEQGFFGVPNCEVKMEIIERIRKHAPSESYDY